MNNADTIAAIATGATNSGIGIIRLSGDNAISLVDKIFVPIKKEKKLDNVKSHTIHYGYIKDGDNIIDEVLVSVMKAPNTYTREDVVEINCHGGIIVIKNILDVVLKNGARAAEAGEFTKRAFLNGRIDLSQAEAVIDIINAKNDYALKSSVSQLRGSISEKIREIREEILEKVAYIEAALDDPEHIEMNGFDYELLITVKDIEKKLETLLKSSDNGRVIKEGIKTVILGKPNAGKSSFLNALLGEERAIVTDIEGTTRDVLEENISIHGISLNVIDTAGIRDTENIVEKIGIDKAKSMAKDADLIIYIADTSRPFDDNDRDIIEFLNGKKAVVLLNKSDLDGEILPEDEKLIASIDTGYKIKISAKTGYGIEEFENAIREMFFEGKIDFNDQIYITNARHKQNISDALESIKMVEAAIENHMSEDFFTIDLMNGYESLGRVIGEAIEDDLADKIFSSFCMGK